MRSTDLAEVRKTVLDFLARTLEAKEVQVIKVVATESGWEAEAEVYEESSFIKALGLSTRVKDRNVYKVKLDGELEVQSYERKGAGEVEE